VSSISDVPTEPRPRLEPEGYEPIRVPVPGHGRATPTYPPPDPAAYVEGQRASADGLRGVVDMMLGHPVPMLVLWGPGLIQIYNDGYAAMAGR
jgi:hypothetical protein